VVVSEQHCRAELPLIPYLRCGMIREALLPLAIAISDTYRRAWRLY